MLDDAVNEMNRAAFKTLTKVMAEQSHIAPQALNALMICRSLERVGDHATNIAEDVIFWVQGAMCATTRAWPPPTPAPDAAPAAAAPANTAPAQS